MPRVKPPSLAEMSVSMIGVGALGLLLQETIRAEIALLTWMLTAALLSLLRRARSGTLSSKRASGSA